MDGQSELVIMARPRKTFGPFFLQIQGGNPIWVAHTTRQQNAPYTRVDSAPLPPLGGKSTWTTLTSEVQKAHILTGQVKGASVFFQH